MTNLWSGGLWIVPLLTGLPAAYCWYRFIRTGYRMPFWFALILTLATVAIVAGILAEN